MSSLLITPTNKKELREIEAFLKTKGIRSRSLSLDQLEDIGLGILMEEADRNQKVSRETIMNKLRKK